MASLPSRKIRLCGVLRATASAFIDHCAETPAQDAALLAELSVLLSRWESGEIHPLPTADPPAKPPTP